MRVFSGSDFSVVYLKILKAVLDDELPISGSRVGPARDMGRVVYELAAGGNRFCMLRRRRFNPFFALAEASWVLAGSRALAPLESHLPSFRDFSDDGKELYGAYGYRLRHAFGSDQLREAIQVLARDPSSRRVVLTIWGVEDLGKDSRDIPCNTTVYVKIRDGKLDVMVCNRSNDIFLGVPYNVVTFAALQAFLAASLGIGSGWQTHVTDSLHLYERDREKARDIMEWNQAEEVERVLESLGRGDLDAYCSLDQKLLLEKYSEEVEGDSVCLAVRNSYIQWRAGLREEAVKRLPPSDVGLAAVGWLAGSRRFEKEWMPSWAKSLAV